jgi:hypothetical protein
VHDELNIAMSGGDNYIQREYKHEWKGVLQSGVRTFSKCVPSNFAYRPI